jgi:hypothetical protein
MFQILDGREHFYQWDSERKLIVLDKDITEVHFCNRSDTCSLVCEVYDADGMRLVNVPNILLQDDLRINVYAYDKQYTKHSQCYKVIRRTRPADYAYTETEIKRYADLEERISALEENGVPGGGGGSVDLTGYATEKYVDDAISTIELTPGPAGPQGEVGPQGPQGEVGPQGEQGDDYQLTEADKKEIAAMAGPPEWQKIDVKLEENVYYFTISIPNAKEVYIVAEMYGNNVEGTLGDIGKSGGYDLFINEQRIYGGLLGQVGVCFPFFEVWEISNIGTHLIISRCGGTDGHMYQLQRSTDILPYEFGPIHTLQLFSYSEYYFDKKTKLEVWYR